MMGGMADVGTVVEEIVKRPEFVSEKLKGELGRIEKLREWEIRDFVILEQVIPDADVEIDRVVGTAHPDYQGLYWSEMLLKGKRMHINLPLLEENPGYYFEREQKLPIMEYLDIDGKIYVSGDGNHRTAIAKVLFHLLGIKVFGKVYLKRWLVDRRALSLYREALNSEIDVRVQRVRTGREDGEGWHREVYEVFFLVKGKRLTVNKFEEYLRAKKGFEKKLIDFLRRWRG